MRPTDINPISHLHQKTDTSSGRTNRRHYDGQVKTNKSSDFVEFIY